MLRILLSLACALLLWGCLGTETGNPSIAAALKARSSEPGTVSLEPAANTLFVTEAWISIREARSVEGALCDHTRTEVFFVGISGDLVPGFPTPGLPDTMACGFHLVFAPPTLLPADAPPGFSGHAVFVRGTRADGAAFEIAARFEHGIDVVGSGPRDFGLDPALLFTADVAVWFRFIDLGTVAPDADGVVRLGPSDAETLEFERGVQASLELFVDADADGALNAAELSAGPVGRSGP